MKLHHEISHSGDGVACLTITGEIHEEEAEALKLYFQSQRLCRFREVVLDLGGLTYIGNSGIGKFLLLYKAMADCQKIVRLTRTPKHIAELFNSLLLDNLFEITTH